MLEANIDNKEDNEANTHKQAISRPDWPKWKEVIQAEYVPMMENETWELTAIPDHRQVITDRWCFRLKKDWDSHILKYKARRVANSFKQEKYIDFVENFAAMVKSRSYKCLFGISMKRRYKI